MNESTILFVDDQEEILILIKRMLKEEPYRLIFAKSGQEALELIKTEQVDVIVTDIMMPNMTGLELLEIVKASHPDIVRVILSGFSQIPTILAAINQGRIYRYITKPWKVDTEAKTIIKDAIAYAELLKSNQRQLEGSRDDLAISLDTFTSCMCEKGETVMVTLDNHVVFVDQKLDSYIRVDEAYTDQKTGELTLASTHQLSTRLKVFFYQ